MTECISHLRCKAWTSVSRPTSGNIFVSCIISASGGTRIPALALSVRPVNSLTHSLITEGPVSSSFSSSTTGLGAPTAGRAVVMTSSFSCVGVSGFLAEVVAPGPSGSARFDLRAGRSDPTKGWRKRLENLITYGGRRYVLRFARSERYICPVRIPIMQTAADPGRRLMTI